MSEAKIPYEIDLAIFFIIVGIILYYFLEVGLGSGLIALAVGVGVFLGWVHYRTELFK